MAFDGECIKQDFVSILENPFPVTLQPDLPDRTTDCCIKFFIDVLADASDADPLRNDFKHFIWYFQPVIISVVMTLQKKVGAVYVDQATLNNNTYGTFEAYGTFTNNQGEKFIRYRLDWRTVLTAFGLGLYRVKVLSTAGIGSPALTGTFYSHEYCLMPYTEIRADGTVRIEYWMNGVTGRADDDRKFKDYGTINHDDQLRIRGSFGFPKSGYEKSYTEYADGNRPFVEDTQEPEYVLDGKEHPFFIHEEFRINIMQADEIAITDYNAMNVVNYVQKYVQPVSGYEPEWKKLQSKLAPIDIKFRQQYNNLRKLRF